MSNNTECIFCNIINKKIPAEIIAQKDNIIAIKDINPVADIHILIIPKEHIASINNITSNNSYLMADMTMLAQELAQKLNISNQGYRLVINTGAHAGQSVNHIHMHLLAGREFSWPPG